MHENNFQIENAHFIIFASSYSNPLVGSTICKHFVSMKLNTHIYIHKTLMEKKSKKVQPI